MSKQASNFQVKFMAWKYRGKEVFKPLNTGMIDEHVKCLREYIANACKIEHIISDEILQKMKKFVTYQSEE